MDFDIHNAIIGGIFEGFQTGFILVSILNPKINRILTIIIFCLGYIVGGLLAIPDQSAFHPMSIVFLICLALLFRNKVRIHLLALGIALFTGGFSSFLGAAAYSLMSNLSGIPAGTSFNPLQNISMIPGVTELEAGFHILRLMGVTLLFYIPLSLVIIKICKPRIDTNPRFLVLVFLLLVSQMLLASTLADMVNVFNQVHGQIGGLITIVIAFVLIFGMNILLLYYAERNEKRRQLEMQIEQMTQQQEMEFEKLHQFTVASAEQKKFAHDINNHLQTLQGLLIDDKSADQLLQGLIRNVKHVEKQSVCLNPIADATIRHKLTRARETGITVDLNVALPAELPFANTDLCSVFSNLLDNAIEACEKLEKERQCISLAAKLSKGFLVIKTTNPTDLAEPVAKTNKAEPDRHGLGLPIVREIAQKYKGQCDTMVRGGQFTTAVTLRLDCEAGDMYA